MADCHDCSRPVLNAHVTDDAGTEWHLRCLDSEELDYLDPSEIKH